MTKTTNYQLNQWAKSDRIMMTDFNADNQKLDAALKAGADAVAAVEAKADQAISSYQYLYGYAGPHMLDAKNIGFTSASFTVSLGDINWNDWHELHLCITPFGSSTTAPFTLRWNGASGEALGTGTANADGSITNVKMLHVVLYPMGHTEANVCGMILGTDAPKLFALGSEWSGASMLHVRFDNGAASFLPATRIVIWGKK